MSAVPSVFEPVTIDDWLDLPDVDGEKYELDAGHLYLMTGGTLSHSLVIGAFRDLVAPDARRHRCRVHSSDARLVIGERGFFPDVMVVCEPMDDDRYETEPCLLVEVLSPSTRRTDTSLKAEVYRSIPSLLAYVIVSVDVVGVELHSRRDTSRPFVVTHHGAGGHVDIACPPMSIAVDDLYADLMRG